MAGRKTDTGLLPDQRDELERLATALGLTDFTLPTTYLGGQSALRKLRRKTVERNYRLQGKKRREQKRRTGARGHRLTITAAPSREIGRKRAKARRPKPVTVRYADGTVETRSADSFKRQQ